ncbi:hypothetical protein PFISCL1PPCAC_3637, partial [Pristionchus fissidentatus]
IMDEPMDTEDTSMQEMQDMSPMRHQGNAGFDINVGGVDVAAHFGEAVPGTSHDSAYDEALARFIRNEIEYDEFMRLAGGQTLGDERLEMHEEEEETTPNEPDVGQLEQMLVVPKGEMEEAPGPSTAAPFTPLPQTKRPRPELSTTLQQLMQEVMNQDEISKPPPFVNYQDETSGNNPGEISRTAAYRERKKMTRTLEALMGQANLIYAKGQSAEALTMLLEVIRQEPRNSEAYRQVAEIYREQGEGELTLQYGLLAAYLDAKTPCDEWVELAEQARTLDRLDMAAAAYGRASRIDPGLWLYWEKRIELLEDTNFRHLAMRARLSALQQTDCVRSDLDFDWFHNMVKTVAEYFIEINDEDKAVQSLETFVMRARQFGRSAASQHETLAGMWIGKGKYKEALKSILALCHDHLKVVNVDGTEIVTVKLHGFAGYDVAPIPLPAEARFEVDDEMPINLMCKVAVCLIHLQCRAPATNLCEIIMMRSYSDIENIEPIAELAQAIYGAEWYSFGRRFVEQLQQWQLLVEDPQLCFIYGNFLAAVKEMDRAMEAYERALQLDPSHVDARINLSGLQQRAGMGDKALETLRDYDLEGCSHLPDERLLMRQAEFLFESNQTEQFIKTARMLLTPYFYEIHRNPDSVAKKRICRNSTVWALSTTLRQAALHAIQNSTLEKFVKRLGAATFQHTNRVCDEMDAVVLHDYCLKLIESLGVLNRHVDMLTVCCYAFLQPKITKDQKSITFQNLLYFCAIKADNWLLAFEYARWYHQTVNNSVLLQLPEKEVIIKRIFNAMNYVFCHSQNVSYHRYVMRALVKNQGNHALQAISGNNSLITGTYRHALGEFLRVWVANKNNPLICMLIGLTFTHMACKKDLSSRHMLALRGLAFMRRYEQTRSVKQEVFYNLGRTFHQLSITTLAIYFYEKALNEPPPKVVVMEDDGTEKEQVAERYDMTRFAAHNLALLYQSSGNTHLAYEIYEKYLVI